MNGYRRDVYDMPEMMPHVKEQPTSVQAAMTFERPHRKRGVRKAVHQYIMNAGVNGRTCEEIEKGLRLKHQTASATIRTLVLTNLVMDSRRTRRTDSGCQAIVWIDPIHDDKQFAFRF